MKLELSVSLITSFLVAKVESINEPNFYEIQVGVEPTLTCDTISPSAYPNIQIYPCAWDATRRILVLQFPSINYTVICYVCFPIR